jgi:hypothetical protein
MSWPGRMPGGAMRSLTGWMSGPEGVPGKREIEEQVEAAARQVPGPGGL